MLGRVGTFAFVLLLVAPAHAETVTFPPFVRGGSDTVQVTVPNCVRAGSRMNCTFIIVNILHFGPAGNCHVHIHPQHIVFEREDANTWAGDVPVAVCQLNNRFRLVRSEGPPKRVSLRLTYEFRDRSEECLKSEREMREMEAKGGKLDMEWTDQGPDKLLPVPFNFAACKTITTGPGQFPGNAFSR